MAHALEISLHKNLPIYNMIIMHHLMHLQRSWVGIVSFLNQILSRGFVDGQIL